MSKQKPMTPEPTCSHCGFPLGNEPVRHFGTHTAHHEDRCLYFLKAEIVRLRTELETAQQENRKLICGDCGTAQSEDQREYNKDCACGGAFTTPTKAVERLVRLYEVLTNKYSAMRTERDTALAAHDAAMKTINALRITADNALAEAKQAKQERERLQLDVIRTRNWSIKTGERTQQRDPAKEYIQLAKRIAMWVDGPPITERDAEALENLNPLQVFQGLFDLAQKMNNSAKEQRERIPGFKKAFEAAFFALNECIMVFVGLAKQGRYPKALSGRGWQFAIDARDAAKAALKLLDVEAELEPSSEGAAPTSISIHGCDEWCSDPIECSARQIVGPHYHGEKRACFCDCHPWNKTAGAAPTTKE